MAYVPPSDWELKDFIRNHAEAVYRSCGFLTLGRGDAGEMTREIFLKVLNQGMEFRSEQDARAWMILTAYQMSRKIPKNAEVSEQGQELLKLKRKDRLVALLYYCEGYRKKEVADYLGCTEASVRGRLARVKRRLDVDEQEDAPETGLPEERAEEPAAEKETAREDTPQEEVSKEEAPGEEATQEEVSKGETPSEEAAGEEETAEEAPSEEESADEEPSQAQRGGETEC